MITINRFRLSLVCFFVTLSYVTPSLAAPLVLGAANSQETWIRENDPDGDFDNDLISVWSSGTGDKRNGLVQFDLSGVTQPILGAVLRLYSTTNGTGNNVTAFDQTAEVISGPVTSTTTWNNYLGMTMTPLDSLGAYNLPAGSPTGRYLSSHAASAGDVALLEAARTGPATVALSVKNDSGSDQRRDWGDGGFGFMADVEDTPTQLIVYTANSPVVNSFSSVSSIASNSSGEEVDSTHVYQFGWNVGESGTDVTVNGRTFYSNPSESTPSGITISSSGSGILNEGSLHAPGGYQGNMFTLMDSCTITAFSGTQFLTLNGLTPSQDYIVQFLMVDADSSGNRDVSVLGDFGLTTSGVFNVSTQTLGSGSTLFATFTAEAATHEFMIQGNNGTRAVLSGVLVMTPIPEPSSLIMLCIGGLAAVRMRRRSLRV